MEIFRIIAVIIGITFIIKGGLGFVRSTNSMLKRGAGFGTGEGTGMNQSEVIQFESGLKWLAAGALLIILAGGA